MPSLPFTNLGRAFSRERSSIARWSLAIPLFFGGLGFLSAQVPTFTPTTIPPRVDLSAWHLVGSAVRTDAVSVRLTDTVAQGGAVWAPCRLDLREDFRLEFMISLGMGAAAADGMAFVLHNASDGFSALGAKGGGMGYADLTESLGYDPAIAIHPSVAIEFDSNYNDEMTLMGEPFFDHIAVVKDGRLEDMVIAGPVMAVPSPTPGVLSHGGEHHVVITWDASTHTLLVVMGNGTAMICTKDLVNEVFAGSTQVVWGWTAATGGNGAEHRVSSLSSCPSPTPTITPLPSSGSGAFLYPNPVRGKVAHLSYQVATASHVRVKVFNSAYDLSAKFEESVGAGGHVMDMDLTGAAPGVYHVLVEVETTAGRKRLPVLTCYLSGDER
jgi:hypothetical protein